MPVRDHYGQTEHGMVIVNGWAGRLSLPVDRKPLHFSCCEVAPSSTLITCLVDGVAAAAATRASRRP